MIRFFLLLLIFPWSVQASAIPDTQESAQKVLENMTLVYSQVKRMKADFAKVSKSNLLGTREKSKGKLEYSQKKFRLEITSKPKSTFIKGTKAFWHISGNEVTTGDVSKAVPSVFESIFSDVTIWSKLGTSYISVPTKTAEIKVDTKGEVPNVSEMVLYIDLDKKTLLRITYLDDVNNSVDITFSNTRFFNKADDKKFVYKPKKKDQVSRI